MNHQEQTTAAARKAYPSDLREAEWAILEPLVPAVKPGGRPARHSRREIVNAILYGVRGGNQWRALPHDLPPWQTAFYYFRIWRNDGTWERRHTALRERTRRQLGREATPSAAILDSQSVKTGQRGGRAATTATTATTPRSR
jgi:transposase